VIGILNHSASGDHNARVRAVHLYRAYAAKFFNDASEQLISASRQLFDPNRNYLRSSKATATNAKPTAAGSNEKSKIQTGSATKEKRNNFFVIDFPILGISSVR
jgi:hypothetical protein